MTNDGYSEVVTFYNRWGLRSAFADLAHKKTQAIPEGASGAVHIHILGGVVLGQFTLMVRSHLLGGRAL